MPPESRQKQTTLDGSWQMPLWTLTEVAAYLRVSPATVRRWTNTGKLACYRLGGNRERRFARETVLAFITQGQQEKTHAS